MLTQLKIKKQTTFNIVIIKGSLQVGVTYSEYSIDVSRLLFISAPDILKFTIKRICQTD